MVLYSHPNKELAIHLENIGDYSKKEVLSKELNLCTIKKDQLADIAYLIGISHDYGKATASFQKFLKSLREDKEVIEHEDHAEISSFFGFFLLKKYCELNHIDTVYTYVASLVIKNHHLNLTDIVDMPFFKSSFDSTKLKNQFEELKKNLELNEVYSKLLKEIGISYDEIIYSTNFETNNFETELDKKILDKTLDKIEIFLIAKLLFSLLVDYDKKDAAEIIKIKYKKKIFENDMVDEYLKKKKIEQPEKFNPEIPLNKLKNKFYEYIKNNKLLNEKQKIYTLTAPTGIGKTLASLMCSIKLQNMINKHFKIIYVLPYTSIIDQNYDEFEKVISSFLGKEFSENQSDYILKHHYLSDIQVKKTDYISENHLNDLMIISSWDTNLVVSTYVQLLISIIGNKNSFLSKFHNIINSIIILDEVQFVGVEYWPLIQEVFKIMAERFNTYFILMTATQPKIFEDCEHTELSDNHFFDDPLNNKISTEVINKDIKLDKFNEEFINSFNTNMKRAILILNTKKSSLLLYNYIKEDKKIFEDYHLYYLSTNLIPKHRREKIEQIAQLQKNINEKYIIVTTQLIEAGVDITSDVCYRDLAPFDSIIQSAGRCNRYFEKEKGNFKVINSLVNENNKPYFSFIYKDSFIIQETRRILKEISSNKELKIDSLADKFFESIKGCRHFDYKKHIKYLQFKQINDNFKIIDENQYTRDLYLCIDEEAKSLLEQLKEEIRSKNRDVFKKLGNIKRIKQKMQDYYIGIEIKLFEKLFNAGYIQSDFRNLAYIPLEFINKFYNEEIGFHAEESKSNKAEIV